MKLTGTHSTSFLLLLLLVSCGKERCAVIPDARVSIAISQGSHIDLGAAGNYVYFDDQGYAGVVVLNNRGQLVAFDRCSTVNVDSRHVVEVVDNAYFVDAHSGARWLLDGSPIAIAECPLKSYPVTTINDGFTYNVRY